MTPTLTDKKFRGNPTRSCCTQQPLRIIGEVLDWEGHSREVLPATRDHPEALERHRGDQRLTDRAAGKEDVVYGGEPAFSWRVGSIGETLVT